MVCAHERGGQQKEEDKIIKKVQMTVGIRFTHSNFALKKKEQDFFDCDLFLSIPTQHLLLFIQTHSDGSGCNVIEGYAKAHLRYHMR